MSKTIAKRTVKAATRKSAVVKAASRKKVATKKTAAKRPATRKAAAKKAPARKPAVRKPVAKKTATSKKAVVRKAAVRKPRLTKKAATIAAFQQIKGIGAKYAESLYANGIKSMDALAKLRKAEVMALSSKMKIGSRMTRDNWVAQAKKLVRQAARKAKGRK